MHGYITGGLVADKPEGFCREMQSQRVAVDWRTTLAITQHGGLSPLLGVGNWPGAILELGSISLEPEMQLHSFSHS